MDQRKIKTAPCLAIGPISLDHLLAKGLGFSPLPLAGRAMAAADWFDRWVGPLYRLAVRLWLAVALAGVALAPAMLPATALAMLPATASALLPRPWALLIKDKGKQALEVHGWNQAQIDRSDRLRMVAQERPPAL